MSARAVTGTVPLSGGRGGPRLGPLEQGLDLCPERLPFFPLDLGEFRQRLGFADSGEVVVALPVFEGLSYGRS